MGSHVRGTGLALVLLLTFALLPARAEEGPTILVDGAPRDAEALRELATEVRETVEAARRTPDADKPLLDALVAEAEALERAATLIDAIVGAPADSEAAARRLQEAKASLQEAQALAAREVAREGVDEKRIAELEAEARQRAVEAKTASDAAAALTALVEKRRSEIDQAAERNAQLEARAAKLAESLAAAPEDAVAQRELLTRQLRTNEVRRGIAILEETHHDALVTLETLRRDAARIEAETEATRQRTADATLASARGVYEEQLVAEAARKEAETRAKLREAELAASPAVAAISRMEALVGRMESERTSELRQLSLLKTSLTDTEVLARISAARQETARALFPAGAALEPWQRETMTESLRQIDRDEQLYARRHDERLENLPTIRARTVADLGRLDVIRQRLDGAQDRTDAPGDEGRTARLEEELAYTQWDDVRLWLQARLDFIRGQTELRPDEVERLRRRWQETTTRLKDVVQARAEDLRQTESVVQDLAEERTALEQSLVDRRAYLDRIAFWLRSAPLPSEAYLSAVARDAQALGAGLAAAPAHLAAVEERVSGTPGAAGWAVGLLVFVIAAVGVRLWVGRRIAGLAVLTRPVQGLDPVQKVARGGAVTLRSATLPALLLLASLWLWARAPDEMLTTILVAATVAWLGIAIGRGIGEAFYRPDGEGRCLAGCEERTARGARRILALALGATGVWMGAALLLEEAGLLRLREVLGFAWGLVAIGLGVWLWLRRDVLLSLVPRETGSALARGARSLLQIGWPLAVLLWGANLVLHAMGYRTASSFYTRRALWFLAALLVVGIAHAMLRALLARRAPPVPDEGRLDTYDPVEARRRVGLRLLGQLLTIGTLVALVVVTSAVFEIGRADWDALGAWSLTGGAPGVGLTLGHLFKAIVIFVVTLLIARHARDLARALMRTKARFEKGTRYAVRTLLFYVILMIGSVAALAALGLDMTQFGWFLTAAGVGIGFGLQEILSNLISGLILFFERPVQVGDVVTVGAIEGDVQQINIRSTVVRTRDGVSIILPNKRLITDEVVNWSHGQKRTRLKVEVGVAYGSDTELVRRVLLERAQAEERVLRWPAPEVEFVGFGDSQLTFTLYAWLATPDIGLRRRVRSDLNTAIDRAFADHGITIPFPQRDVHLKRPPRPEP